MYTLRSKEVMDNIDRTKDWLEAMYKFVEQESSADALDILFDKMDSLMCAGEFALCDEILTEIDVKRLNITVTLGVLAITWAGKSHLKQRDQYFQRAKDHIIELDPDRAEELLKGLG